MEEDVEDASNGSAEAWDDSLEVSFWATYYGNIINWNCFPKALKEWGLVFKQFGLWNIWGTETESYYWYSFDFDLDSVWQTIISKEHWVFTWYISLWDVQFWLWFYLDTSNIKRICLLIFFSEWDSIQFKLLHPLEHIYSEVRSNHNVLIVSYYHVICTSLIIIFLTLI